jgi:hypothetical protein
MYLDAHGRLRAMLLSWTSLGGRDAFAQISAGRSWWRADDLLDLAALVSEITQRMQR